MRPDYAPFSSAYAKVMRILTGEDRRFPEERFQEIVGFQERSRAVERELGLAFAVKQEHFYAMDKLALTLENIVLPMVREFREAPLREFASAKGQKARRELPASYWFGEKIGAKIESALKILESLFRFHWIDASCGKDFDSIPYGLKTLIGFERDLRRLGGPVHGFDVEERMYYDGLSDAIALRCRGESLPAVNMDTLDKRLPIGGLNLSERCFGCCPRCSIDARPSDGQMDWALLHALLESPQIAFMPQVHLGDGEVLLYEGGEEGKNLADAIREILFARPVGVQFTTAGLIPQNRKAGVRVLEGLGSLGPYASDIAITVSFNFFFKDIGSIDRYVQSMEETFELLSGLPCQKDVIVMYSKENEAETKGRFASLQQKYGLELAHGGYPMRLIGSSGRGLEKMPASVTDCSADVLTSMISNAIRRDFGLYDNTSFADRGKLAMCKGLGHTGEVPPFTVRSDGALTVHCFSPGTRGTCIGHVARNDAQQVIGLERVFREELHQRVLEHPGKTFCSEHRAWNKTFRAPESGNPIVNVTRTRNRTG